MKKLLALLMLLTLMPCAAMADFDTDTLLEQPGLTQSLDASWNTIYSLPMPFYMGEVEDGELLVTLDYIHHAEVEMTLVRVDVLLMLEDMLRADTVTFTVGGKCYAFSVTAEVFEYDGIYQEDYAICLTDAGLPFLKALAQQKKDDPIPVEFLVEDEVRLSGVVVIPGDDAAEIYDLYIDLGGKTQELKSINDLWPVKITK